jgi:D-3-phosphoglycerate dehydrogenase
MRRILIAGRIHADSLDVFADEPADPAGKWRDHDALILTPHTAGLTQECAARMAVIAIRNILDFCGGRIDRSLVVNADAIGL